MTPETIEALESAVIRAESEYDAAGRVLRLSLAEVDAAQMAVAAAAKRYDDAVRLLDEAREVFENEQESEEQSGCVH